MKSEELLTGLSEVGEDLLAETENGIRVSTKKPRAWIGLAAALALVVGLGGLIFWQVRKHRQSTPADPAATVTMPGPEAEALEQFYVDRNWRGESAWTFDNLERSLRVNRWTLETGADRLPVYEVATNHPDLDGWTWEGGMDQSLRGILNEAAARLGLPEPEDVRIQENGSEIAWVEADTEMGVLTVYLNGTVRILFDEEHYLTATVKLDFAEELSGKERDAEYRDAVMEACGEQVVELLGLPACHPAVCDRYSSLSSGYTAYILYPVREDPAEQLKSRYFEQVRMLTVSGREVLGLEWERLPEAGGTCTVPADWRLVGNYPIISAEEAKQAALRGGYYCESTLSPLVTEENLAWGELVYLPGNELGYLLPFYRFWVPCREGEVTSLTDCAALYVPAVDPDYLIDYPEQMPVVVDDPEPSVTTTAPDEPGIEETEGPNGQDPAVLPVLSLANCFGNNGEEGKLFRDPNNEIALSPISDFDRNLPGTLPVYKNEAYVDESGIPVFLSAKTMQAHANALVQRWGLTVQSQTWIDGARRPDDPEDITPNPSALILETDKATITVYGSGEQTVFFREPLDKDTELAAEWVYDPAAPLTPESAAAYAQAWAEYCEGCDGIQVQCEPVYGYADMEARTYTCIYYLTEPADSEETAELAQRLLEYSFHEQLYMDERGNLTGYRTHQFYSSGSPCNYATELIGTYPILSKAEADQALKNGFFFTNASMPVFRNGKPLGEALLAHTVAAELVYRTGNDRYFLPYYRYWVVGDVPETAGGLTQCGAVYVPAIPEEYLTDWPEYLMPGWFGDDELAELQALFEDENSWYGRILRCGAFPSPDLVPLGNLLSAGLPGVDNTLAPDERAELEAAATAEQLDTGVEPVKLPKQALNDLLQSALGLTLDQIQYNDLRDWVYLEDRDCFYLFAGDPGGIIIEVESYLALSDNELQLRYWRLDGGSDEPVMYVANLRKTDAGYQVLSNELAVWNN